MPDDLPEEQQMVIAPPPNGLTAMRMAVDFVAKGTPISDQMIESLERMLNNQQERIDLLTTVFSHVQVERLRNILEGMAVVESRVFHPAMIANYSGRELLELLKLSQAEIRAIVGYLEAKGTKGVKTTPEGITNVANPEKAQELKDAEESVGGISTGGRDRIRALLGKVMHGKPPVIDVEAANADGE